MKTAREKVRFIRDVQEDTKMLGKKKGPGGKGGQFALDSALKRDASRRLIRRTGYSTVKQQTHKNRY